MYFIWWNHSSACAMNSFLAWSDLPGWCMQQWLRPKQSPGEAILLQGTALGVWDVVGDWQDDSKIYLPDGDMVGDLFSSRTAKLLKVCSMKQRKFSLVSENPQPDLRDQESCSLKPTKALTTPGGRSCNERNRCTHKFDKSSNFPNSGGGKLGSDYFAEF